MAIVLGLLQTACLAVAAWSFWIVYSKPRRLLELTGEAVPLHDPRHRAGAGEFAFIGAWMLGLAAMCFGAAHSALGWLPEGWGSADEYGEWTSLRFVAASITAVFGAVLLQGFLRSCARSRGILEEQRTERA